MARPRRVAVAGVGAGAAVRRAVRAAAPAAAAGGVGAGAGVVCYRHWIEAPAAVPDAPSFLPVGPVWVAPYPAIGGMGPLGGYGPFGDMPTALGGSAGGVDAPDATAASAGGFSGFGAGLPVGGASLGVPGGAGGSGPAAQAVPEPATVAVLIVALAAVVWMRRGSK